MFSVLVIRLRSLRLLRVSGIVMRLRMFLLLITFLKASHSFRNRLLVICKNAYLFATMIMTSVSSPFSCCSGIVRLNLIGRAPERFLPLDITSLLLHVIFDARFLLRQSGSAGMPRPISYAVFCLKKKTKTTGMRRKTASVAHAVQALMSVG